MTPIKGKEFEELVLFRARRMEEAKTMTLGRYGVQVAFMKGPDGKPEMKAIKSLPDFEGVIFGTGRQLIVETKVCSQASYPLRALGAKHPRQIDHMLLRAEFGALTYLLIHFNRRDLISKSEEAETFALHVHPDIHFWRDYQADDRTSLTRASADLNGVRIPWNLYSSRASKLTPDLSVLLDETPFSLKA